MMNSENYFVEIRHRPRRVAFLLDPDNCSDALLNGIVEFNVDSWGGRYNPVVPVVEGQIPDAYWSLLDFANPDVIYAFVDLPHATASEILRRLRPLETLQHNWNLDPDPTHVRVIIDNQATVVPALRQRIEGIPTYARLPDPAVLVVDYKVERQASSFTRRNFGITRNLQLWCRDSRIPFVPSPADDEQLMRLVAENRNLILPISACADAPRGRTAVTDDQGSALTICYGTSPWNFIEYWNFPYFQNLSSWGGLKVLWMPPEFLEGSSLYQALIELMRRRVFVSDHQSRLRLISYDEPEQRMREITKRICTDFKWNMYPSDPIVRTKGDLPAFQTRPIARSFASPLERPRHELVSGRSSFLRLAPPHEMLRDDDKWMAEFVVEDAEQERFLANRPAWWKLPKRYGIANLFFPQAPCRVGNDYVTSVEVSGRLQGVVLNIPEVATLFDAIIVPRSVQDWSGRVNPSQAVLGSRSLYTCVSDKGRYARGVLGLFESLQKAAYVFEHQFWRGLIESLSSPVASENTRNKVRSELERLSADGSNSALGLDGVVDQVLDAAGRIQRPTRHVTFNAMFASYWEYLKTLPHEEQIMDVIETSTNRRKLSGEKAIRNAARANLCYLLSEMTARKLFLHGAEIRCDHCFASLWYHIDDLHSVVTCRGCRKDVNLPAEVPWSYALNELVVSAVRDHGVAPVIRTAFRLLKDSRECFRFLPGIEIRDYGTDPETQVCEFDLVWIRDGEFGVSEVKRTPRSFSVGKKLAAVLSSALPDRFLLVSASGTNEQMQSTRAEIESTLGEKVNVEAWDPAIFERASRDGWNTVRYSLLG